MNVGYSQHMKNGHAYKNKWGAIFENFKNIFYHILETWQNESYLAMSP
jgi:hypothetical protein